MSRPDHSPSEIVLQFLIDLGWATEPDHEDDWPGFFSVDGEDSLDHDKLPDNAIFVADTQGVLSGSDMETGDSVEHFGIQIRVRNKRYQDAHLRSAKIEAAIDRAKKAAVTLGETNYQIDAITRTTGTGPIGRDSQQRSNYVLNAKVSITQL